MQTSNFTGCSYPVVFRCAECAMEYSTIEELESHVWSLHLRTFPFRCAVCDFGSNNFSGIQQHCEELHEHSDRSTMDFRRSVQHEMKIKKILAASIAVRIDPMNYVEEDVEEEEELFDEDTLEELNMNQEMGLDIATDDLLNGMIGVRREVAKNNARRHDVCDMNMIEDMVFDVDEPNSVQVFESHKDDQMNDVQEVQDGEEIENQEIISESGMMNSKLVELVDEDGELELDDCGEGSSYQYYEGSEIDEDVQFVDEDGNPLYFQNYDPQMEVEESPSKLEQRSRIQKLRHIDMVVSRVACAQRSNRKTSEMYRCDVCDKYIQYPSKIEEHKRSHNGLRPYTCTQCGTSFSQKGGLTTHMRLHTGHRPFHCTWECGKSFVSSSALRMHERCHSGERPYVCRVCGRTFSKKSHRIRHEAAVHPEDHSTSGLVPIMKPYGLAAAGKDVDILKDLVNAVIEEVRQERGFRERERCS